MLDKKDLLLIEKLINNRIKYFELNKNKDKLKKKLSEIENEITQYMEHAKLVSGESRKSVEFKIESLKLDSDHVINLITSTDSLIEILEREKFDN